MGSEEDMISEGAPTTVWGKGGPVEVSESKVELVDRYTDAQPVAGDEDAILHDLYGDHDDDGIYRGEGDE